jgi:hypothetical protein
MARISTSAAKAKGRRLQDFVAESFRKMHPSLEEDDVKTAIMGESGTDIKLSPAARRLIPFDTECKNQEKLNIWASISQCETNCKESRIPLLVFKRNRTKTYACIEFEKLLELLQKTKADVNSTAAIKSEATDSGVSS